MVSNRRGSVISFRGSPQLVAEVEALAAVGLTKTQILKRGLEQGVEAGKDFKEGYLAALAAALGLFEEGSDAWNDLCELCTDDLFL